MTAKDAAPQIPAHYVYLYRDPETKAIRYVGKGKGNRVEKHLRESHNPELREWVDRLHRSRKQAPIVEIIPCETDAEAYAIEAALISALWKGRSETSDRLFNLVRGRHARFAPLGLPASLAERRYEQPLLRDDFVALGGALVILISTTDFEDHGASARPRLDLPSSEVRRRISEWWQIGPHVRDWVGDPEGAPRLLVGVTGPPRGRWVWGSCWINHKKWGAADGGLWQVPVSGLSVDAAKLRGRVIAPGQVGPIGSTGDRHFGGITTQFFDVVHPARGWNADARAA